MSNMTVVIYCDTADVYPNLTVSLCTYLFKSISKSVINFQIGTISCMKTNL